MPAPFRWKAAPEDFRVAERSTLPRGDGEFAVYTLAKRGIGTPEAVAVMCRALGVPLAAASFGGLKDAQAITEQQVAVLGGPPRAGASGEVAWNHLGQALRGMTPADIEANVFNLTLRDVTPSAAAALPGLVAGLPALPNYFDAQRFGSRGESGEFVAAALCGKQWEHALWLALGEPNRRDRPAERRAKEFLAEAWGDWRAIAMELPPPAGPAAAMLVRRPGDWHAALRTLPSGLLGLQSASFQSWLWNAWLDALVRAATPPDALLALPIERDWGAAAIDGCPENWLAEALPYPSARNPLPDPERLFHLEPTLAGLGLDWRRLKIDAPREACMPKGGRTMAFRPADTACEVRGELARVRFALPRGCYATIVLAWLAARC